MDRKFELVLIEVIHKSSANTYHSGKDERIRFAIVADEIIVDRQTGDQQEGARNANQTGDNVDLVQFEGFGVGTTPDPDRGNDGQNGTEDNRGPGTPSLGDGVGDEGKDEAGNVSGQGNDGDGVLFGKDTKLVNGSNWNYFQVLTLGRRR